MIMKKTILILATNPKDTARLRLDKEVKEISEGLQRSKYRDNFIIQSRLAVNLKDVRRALLDYEPHIVHFCGHGKSDGLILENESGNAVLIQKDILARLFELFKNQIECVLLNACYTELQAEVISQYINYVIGMNKNINDKTAIEFAVGFYDAIGAGKEIEVAFKFGYSAISVPVQVMPILKKKKVLEKKKILKVNKQMNYSILAVMGVRGGVGKGTFVACIAQLFAEANYEITIIDYDLESCGTTHNALRRFGIHEPPVKTVFDHIAPKSKGFTEHKVINVEKLWNITPAYIREKKLGKIWLIPASNPLVYTKAFNVVANLPINRREEILLEITDEIINRILSQAPCIRWIIIDCGAGKNPIYSAAFRKTNYGYIIISPSESFFDEIKMIKMEHYERYKDTDLSGIFTVVNRVTSLADIKRTQRCNPVGFIPRNPLFEEEDFQNSVDYDLGYDDITIAVCKILNSTLIGEDKTAIPDEITIRILPWWRQFVEKKVAFNTLKSASFHTRTILLLVGTVIGITGSLFFLLYNILRKYLLSPLNNLLSLTISLLFFIFICLTGVCVFLLIPHWKKHRLLKKLSNLSSIIKTEHYIILEKMLDDTNNSSIKWLRSLLRNAQELEKTRRKNLINY